MSVSSRLLAPDKWMRRSCNQAAGCHLPDWSAAGSAK